MIALQSVNPALHEIPTSVSTGPTQACIYHAKLLFTRRALKAIVSTSSARHSFSPGIMLQLLVLAFEPVRPLYALPHPSYESFATVSAA